MVGVRFGAGRVVLDELCFVLRKVSGLSLAVGRCPSIRGRQWGHEGRFGTQHPAMKCLGRQHRDTPSKWEL